jgi:signal transduction histidine kinase
MSAGKGVANKFSRSLSSKLLGLTVIFVLLAELVVLIPSVSTQRIDWLNDRIEAAYLVGLALDSPSGKSIDSKTTAQLFATANILGVTLDVDGARMPVMTPRLTADQSRVMRFVNLASDMPQKRVLDAWATMLSAGDHSIRVVGRPKYAPAVTVDLFVSQAALRKDLHIYARNILTLSIVISSIAAALVFWSLNNMIVAPLRRLTHNMLAFEKNPDDKAAILSPGVRLDEIGVAERGLASLEARIQTLLSERRRLAALGAGISKISHDLRNILASAQLMSDRLAKSDDPRVRKLSPRLISALDRAIALSRDTLSYARMEPSALKIEEINLHALIDDVIDDNASMAVSLVNTVDERLVVAADQTQLYRAISNLVRNAVEALAPLDENGGAVAKPGASVTVRAHERAGEIAIDIADNGPGIPESARAELFEPFKGSLKPGGSGLGVAIAAEIARAHRGALSLEKSDDTGATFRLTVPKAKPQ